MRIRLDQRLELLLTAMFISDYDTKGFCVDPEDEYAREALEKFGSFVAHPAVANISRVWDTEIDCSSPPHYALTLTEDIKLDPSFNLDQVRESLVPNADLSRFTADLRGFHRKADFTLHFSQLQSRLAPWLEKLNDLIARRPVQHILEHYLGQKLPATEVLLCTLTRPFLSVTVSGTRGETLYCLCSRKWLEIAEQKDSLERILISAIWHEFSHHEINPLTFGLYDNLNKLNQEQVNWCCALNESIINAITIRLLLQEEVISEKHTDWMVKNAERNKASQTRAVLDLLLDYEQNRSRYPDISSIHPRLVEAVGPPPR